jgi:putative ABC transport system substrate-binding protein
MNRRESIIAVVALGAAAGPIASFAQQQSKVWRVGFLSPVSASSSSQNTDAFLKGMQELGYVEGKNLVIEWRFADGEFERLPGLAADLVQLKMDSLSRQRHPQSARRRKRRPRFRSSWLRPATL